MTHCTSIESESIDVKLIELKFWDGNHAKHASLKRVYSKVRLGTLNFNNMKNVEARSKALDDIQVMDNFIVGNETHRIKDYLLYLKVDNMRIFIAVQQGGGKIIKSVMVMVLPKAKVAARK